MANYTAPLLMFPMTGAYKGAGNAQPIGRRMQIYEIEFGQTGGLSSSDCQVQWDVSRSPSTAAAVGSGVAPSAVDPGDTFVSTVSYLNNLTTEPTNVTGAGAGLSLKNWGINQRGSYRWRALDDGDNIIVAAASPASIEVRCLSLSFASSAIGTITWLER